MPIHLNNFVQNVVKNVISMKTFKSIYSLLVWSLKSILREKCIYIWLTRLIFMTFITQIDTFKVTMFQSIYSSIRKFFTINRVLRYFLLFMLLLFIFMTLSESFIFKKKKVRIILPPKCCCCGSKYCDCCGDKYSDDKYSDDGY